MFIAAKRSVTRPPPGGPWSLDIFCPESHQRSWWIVHTQPTKRAGHTRSQIPPTQLVDHSYPAYKKGGAHPVPNPTDTVSQLVEFGEVCGRPVL